MTDTINPKWAKASMTLQQAANQAYKRGSILKISWSPMIGLRVVAVQVREMKERKHLTLPLRLHQFDYIFESPRWELGGSGINASHRLTAEYATPQVADAIQKWFAQQQTDGRLLLEKNPRNVLRIP